MAESDDPTNNIQWVILAVCGGLIVVAACILLCVFCCCGICGRGGGMCGPGCMQGGQQFVVIQNPGPTEAQNTVAPTGEGANPVPDPTFVSKLDPGGNIKFNQDATGKTTMAGDKMRVIKLEKNDPTTAVRQVVREYYKQDETKQSQQNAPLQRLPQPPEDPAVPTYIVQDSGYAPHRAAPPYQLIRNRDPGFDQATWVPPWQRRH